MKPPWLSLTAAMIFTLTASSLAQTSEPETLPYLVAQIPILVHAKKMNWGAHAHAMEDAFRRDPASIARIPPIASNNLDDADPEVISETVGTLYGLALESGDTSVITAVADKLLFLMTSGPESCKNGAMLLVAVLGVNAPDSLVTPLFALLKNASTTDEVAIGAASTLMAARPANDVAQAAVLAALNTPGRPVEFRCPLLYAAASELVGTLITANIITLANTSTDKGMRDCAISAAERVGNRALLPINPRLQEITNDPSETPESKRNAEHAMKISARRPR